MRRMTLRAQPEWRDPPRTPTTDRKPLPDTHFEPAQETLDLIVGSKKSEVNGAVRYRIAQWNSLCKTVFRGILNGPMHERPRHMRVQETPKPAPAPAAPPPAPPPPPAELKQNSNDAPEDLLLRRAEREIKRVREVVPEVEASLESPSKQFQLWDVEREVLEVGHVKREPIDLQRAARALAPPPEEERAQAPSRALARFVPASALARRGFAGFKALRRTALGKPYKPPEE